MSKFALLFLMVFVGGVIAALVYSGAAAFILYQLVYFLNPDDRWWSAQIPGLSYSFFISVLMLAILAIQFRKFSHQSAWFENPAFRWLALLLLTYYLAYLWAIVPSQHHKFTFIFTKLVVIIFVAYKLLNNRKALTASIWAYIVGATYIGYLATITGRNAGDRLEGIALPDTIDANGVAITLVPAGVLLLYYACSGSKKIRLIAVMCGALVANGLVLFNSRGAFLGVIFSCGIFLLYLFFSKYRQKGQRMMAIFIVAIGVSGALYITDDLFWERMDTLQNLESKDSGSGRVAFWMATFDMLDDHPMGMGVWGYNSLASLYMTEEVRGGNDSGRGEYRSVHSLWFQGLSEVGWQGLFCFVMMILSVFRYSRKARLKSISNGDYQAYFLIIALESALAGYLVSGSVINQFRAEILYWMVLLVAVSTKIFYFQRVAEEGTSVTRENVRYVKRREQTV